MKEIYLAGGCFWGVERYFSLLKGVLETEVGYANGNLENPSYEMLINHQATHAETVYLKYDSNLITLSELLDHFFRFVNPHLKNRQGADIGIQYRSGIYYLDPADKTIIENYLAHLKTTTKKTIYTECLPLSNYYKAESYHQNYLLNNPNGYCHVDLSLLKEEEKK